MSGSNRIWVPLLLALAACAKPGPWTKEGATEERVAADERACELKATEDAQQRRSKTVSTMGPAVVGPTTRRSTSPSGGPFADQRGTQLADEDQFVRECMEANGYTRGATKRK